MTLGTWHIADRSSRAACAWRSAWTTSHRPLSEARISGVFPKPRTSAGKSGIPSTSKYLHTWTLRLCKTMSCWALSECWVIIQLSFGVPNDHVWGSQKLFFAGLKPNSPIIWDIGSSGCIGVGSKLTPTALMSKVLRYGAVDSYPRRMPGLKCGAQTTTRRLKMPKSPT